MYGGHHIEHLRLTFPFIYTRPIVAVRNGFSDFGQLAPALQTQLTGTCVRIGLQQAIGVFVKQFRKLARSLCGSARFLGGFL